MGHGGFSKGEFRADRACRLALRLRLGDSASPDLVAAALAALKRIRSKSELQELWDESKDSEKWHKAIEELESRLRG